MARKKRLTKFYATYKGEHKKISLTGIGEINPGKEFEVPTERIFNSLKQDPNFKTRVGWGYEDKG